MENTVESLACQLVDQLLEPSGWAYHATLRQFLPDIRRNGLTPKFSRAAGEKVIFCEPDQAEAEIYLETGGVLLRWQADEIAGCTPDGESVWFDPVPPEELQILDKNGTWHRLMDQLPESRHWLGRNKTAIYHKLINVTGSGPFDGGCVIFAQALQIRYGGEIWALIKADGRADHAVLRVGGTFIDGDGLAASQEEAIQRFNANEHANAAAARPFQDSDLPEAPRDSATATDIARLLPPLDQPSRS